MLHLDRADLAILRELQRDGRISNRELAERVALSTAPCWRRVRALEKKGIIKAYAALLDADKIGLTILAFAHVSLENHHAATVAKFEQAVAATPEVLECYMTSGDYDYLLKVATTDMAAYERFFSSTLVQSGAVRAVNTSFVFRQKKFTTAMPLERLASRK